VGQQVQPLQIKKMIAEGLALHQQGKFNEAKVIYEKILATQANHYEALHFLGVLFAQTNQFTKATEFLIKALEIKPDYVEAHNNLGNVFKELKCLEEALASYDQAIRINPNYANAHFNRGNVLKELKRLDEALASYDQATSINPNYAEAYYNRGITLKELKRLEEALASYDQAIKVKPYYAEAYNNRSTVLKELNRLEEALTSYDQAVRIKPDYVEAYNNLGNVLKELQLFDKALASYDQAIRLKPNFAEAYYNRGVILQELNRVDEALFYYDQALSIKPDYTEANLNKSFVLLLNGDFVQGWKEYEWRWKNEKVIPFHINNRREQPLWLGAETLKDKTILLYSEQGLGDTIQFCRYVPLVAELGAKVILEVQRPLVNLLKDLSGVSQIIGEGDALPTFEYRCPLMSLPFAFKTEMNTIPSASKIITCNNAMHSKWQTKLGEKTKPRVGLVWCGNKDHKNDHNRSLILSELLPHLPTNIDYICLQKELRDIDKLVLEKNSPIQFYGETIEDFTDTAALCDLMDIVISVDTCVAHLAGTQGKQTWILLPYSPDWRWLLDRDDSPWYSSVKLYRQEKIADWHGVFENLRRDLEKLL
jgi:tetratricopeptide (TPR) repeat protein